MSPPHTGQARILVRGTLVEQNAFFLTYLDVISSLRLSHNLSGVPIPPGRDAI